MVWPGKASGRKEARAGACVCVCVGGVTQEKAEEPDQIQAGGFRLRSVFPTKEPQGRNTPRCAWRQGTSQEAAGSGYTDAGRICGSCGVSTGSPWVWLNHPGDVRGEPRRV